MTAPVSPPAETANEMTLYSAPDVQLVDCMGSDRSIAAAARVSTAPDLRTIEADESKDAGLINYLMEHRHGSPFEHGALTFYVKCPIHVVREFMRHRIGFSYNEMSSRYTTLHPDFYVPAPDRPLRNVGSSARPHFAAAPELYDETIRDMVAAYDFCWSRYIRMLDRGVAREVARDVLPVGVFTQFYVTCNPRSLMAFLSLRTRDESAKYPSAPLFEIEQVARRLEAVLADKFPATYAAFQRHGRVGP